MRLGYKRDYEVDAICDFAQIVKIVAFDHPEDAALQAYCSKVKMTAIMLLIQDQRAVGKTNILKDRRQDCRECELAEKMRPCMVNGKRGACKYKSIEYQARFIEKHLGTDAFKPLMPYIGQYEKERVGQA